MEKHFASTRKLGNRRDFVARVNRSKLRRLGNADRAGLVRMQLVLACDHLFCLADVDLAIGAANQKQLRSFREKFRSATFVGLNVGILVTGNAVERLAKLRECQGVCCRAIENETDVAISLEDFTDAIAHARRPAIVAVRCYCVCVRLFQCRPRLWTNCRSIVASKFIAAGIRTHLACLLREFLFPIN